MKDREEPVAPARPCAICGKPQQPEYRPFCSRRCADVDLGRWMNGAYTAPAEELDDPDQAELEAALQARLDAENHGGDS